MMLYTYITIKIGTQHNEFNRNEIQLKNNKNDTEHSDIQHNDTKQNGTKHIDKMQNDIQQ
jgi:hypothetical protein